MLYYFRKYFVHRKEIKDLTKSINFLVIKLQQQDEEIENLNNTIKQSFDLTDKLNEFERHNSKLVDSNKALLTNNQKQAQKIKELTAGLERLTVSKQQVITDFITRNIAGAKALKDVSRGNVEQRKVNCGFYDRVNHRYIKPQEQTPMFNASFKDGAMALSNNIPQITADAKKHLFCDDLTHVNFKSNYPYLQRRFDNINYLFADYKLTPSDEPIDYTLLNHFDKGEHMSNNRIEYLNYFIRVEQTNGKCCFVACHETGIKNIVTGFFDSKSWAINNLDKLIKHIESITPPMKGQ